MCRLHQAVRRRITTLSGLHWHVPTSHLPSCSVTRCLLAGRKHLTPQTEKFTIGMKLLRKQAGQDRRCQPVWGAAECLGVEIMTMQLEQGLLVQKRLHLRMEATLLLRGGNFWSQLAIAASMMTTLGATRASQGLERKLQILTTSLRQNPATVLVR